MPSSEATYVVLLSRACPGTFSYDQILHDVPLAVGHELIHAARIRDGEPMIWPDASLSVIGRWWEKITRRFTGR